MCNSKYNSFFLFLLIKLRQVVKPDVLFTERKIFRYAVLSLPYNARSSCYSVLRIVNPLFRGRVSVIRCAWTRHCRRGNLSGRVASRYTRGSPDVTHLRQTPNITGHERTWIICSRRTRGRHPVCPLDYLVLYPRRSPMSRRDPWFGAWSMIYCLSSVPFIFEIRSSCNTSRTASLFYLVIC